MEAPMPTHADVCPVAKMMVRKSLAIKPGENVIVESWDHQLQLAGDIVYWCREAGAKPLLVVEREEDVAHSLKLPASKLGKVGSHEWAALEEADAYAFIPGPADPTIFDENPGKREAFFANNSEWYRRARRYGVRGSRSLLGYVSPTRAKLHGIGYEAWRRMILDASLVDPAKIARRASALAKALEDGREMEISAPNGTKLFLALKYRPIRDDGITDKRDIAEDYPITYYPGGGVWTAVEEGSAEGRVVFDRPSFQVYTRVHELEWRVAGGHLVDYTGGQGLGAFTKAYDGAGKGKEVLGEVDIGLNPKMDNGTPFDYSVMGSVALSLGDNTFVGGKNPSEFSASGILSHATVAVDGRTVVRRGRLA
jgi:leucyl aminopeptidase (aminopeptidase T)